MSTTRDETGDTGRNSDADTGATDEAAGDPTGKAEGAAGWGATARERVERGLDRGKEAFTAFKDALEETFTEAREKGDLPSDRARDLWGKAVDRARDATSDARDRFDFATRAEIEALERRVAALEVLLGVTPEEAPSDSSTEAPPTD